MPQLEPGQWDEIVKAYKTEKKADGRPVSCRDLAKRYNLNTSVVVIGLNTRGVKMRPNNGGGRRGPGDPETVARVRAAKVAARNAAIAEDRSREPVAAEIRQSAHVHACSEILEKHGRLYFREIERAFGCSSFDAATIAKAVRERTGAAFDFEASPGPGGVRLFLVAKVAIPVVACVDGFLKCASGAHRSHPGKSCVEIDRTGQTATAEEMHP